MKTEATSNKLHFIYSSLQSQPPLMPEVTNNKEPSIQIKYSQSACFLTTLLSVGRDGMKLPVKDEWKKKKWSALFPKSKIYWFRTSAAVQRAAMQRILSRQQSTIPKAVDMYESCYLVKGNAVVTINNWKFLVSSDALGRGLKEAVIIFCDHVLMHLLWKDATNLSKGLLKLNGLAIPNKKDLLMPKFQSQQIDLLLKRSKSSVTTHLENWRIKWSKGSSVNVEDILLEITTQDSASNRQKRWPWQSLCTVLVTFACAGPPSLIEYHSTGN